MNWSIFTEVLERIASSDHLEDSIFHENIVKEVEVTMRIKGNKENTSLAKRCLHPIIVVQ